MTKIQNPILYMLSWFTLDMLHDKYLNYLYVDTFAKEHVLQQKTEPNRAYTITSDYKLLFFPCSLFETLQSFKKKNEPQNSLFTLSDSGEKVVCNDDLCKITGIKYYNFVEQHKNHICIIDLDKFYDK